MLSVQSWIGQSLLLFSCLAYIYLEEDVDYWFYVLLDPKNVTFCSIFFSYSLQCKTCFYLYINFVHFGLLIIVDILRNSRKTAWGYLSRLSRLDVNSFGIYYKRTFMMAELTFAFLDVFTVWVNSNLSIHKKCSIWASFKYV